MSRCGLRHADGCAQGNRGRRLPAYHEAIDGFLAAGGEAEIPKVILGVKREYLDAAFDQLETEYGSIDQYFSDALGSMQISSS